MVEQLVYGGRLFAVIVRASHSKPGIEFFTPPEASQQLAYMNRPSGHVIAPHVHNASVRQVRHSGEALFVRSGRVRVDLHDDASHLLGRHVLRPGDMGLFTGGRRFVHMLTDSEIIQVLQGPWSDAEYQSRLSRPLAIET